jgi:hypothetical protein
VPAETKDRQIERVADGPFFWDDLLSDFRDLKVSAVKAKAGGAPKRGHTNKAARRLCPTSLLRNVRSSYSEKPGVEIL